MVTINTGLNAIVFFKHRFKEDYCIGCFRTLDEIRDWMIMSEYEQKKLKHELMWRKECLKLED